MVVSWGQMYWGGMSDHKGTQTVKEMSFTPQKTPVVILNDFSSDTDTVTPSVGHLPPGNFPPSSLDTAGIPRLSDGTFQSRRLWYKHPYGT